MIGRSLGHWLARRDPRRVCKALHLDGWEHLVAADGANGVLIEIEPDGPWPIAAWAIATYRQGLDLLVETGDPNEARALGTVGVRAVDRLPTSGRRAVVGTAERPDLRVVASGDRKGFRVRVSPVQPSDGTSSRPTG